MRSYSSRDVIRLLVSDGWKPYKTVGDHHSFKHPTKPGKVTVPHPNKDLPIKTLKSIARQAGIELE